ncbi:MAG: hypothetical protein HYV42_02330 [Candidatus Magasanikbacteria bacterium]|nr:hypothetical protein [Candidatus Magasanikbacteria bacterium]
MHVVDLTDAYCATILGRGGLSGYCHSYPTLFKHYFQFWAKARYWHAVLRTPAAVRRQRVLVRSRLPMIEKKLARAGLDVSQVKLILFVGQNTSNGHAWLDRGKFAVWIPIEAYQSKLQVDVFVTHEILHGLQYARRPEFYFTTERERRMVKRQLITEGFATWASARVLGLAPGTALWADYLSPQKRKRWLLACRRREAELKLYLASNFGAVSATAARLFYANDPGDVFAYRAGYWAGFKAVERVVRHYRYGVSNLLNLPRPRFERLVKYEYLLKK